MSPAADPQADRAAASYTFRNSLAATGSQGVSKGLAPARGQAGETDRRQGAPVGEGPAEGGRTREEGGVGDQPRRHREHQRHPKRRHHVRSVRLSDRELALIKAAAAAARLTDAGFIASAAVSVAEAPDDVRVRLTDRRELVAELMAATAHLARVGNNLNQVARTLNAGGEAVHAEVVLRLIARAASRVEEAAQQLVQTK
jgi:uncharacterized protein (DUF1778 family)